jgi:hypothetical protein
VLSLVPHLICYANLVLTVWGWWVFDFCDTHQFQVFEKKSKIKEPPVLGI